MTAPDFDEATLLALRNHADEVRRFDVDGGLAVLFRGELSLWVGPEARGQGLGRELAQQALDAAGPGQLRAWSHTNHPAAAALAARFGFEKVRELWVMRRPLTVADDVAWPALPPGLEWRTFHEVDAPEVVRVNAAAFAGHPEQGAMDAANLAERMGEPWFDPAGLVEIWDPASRRLAGFHWTKRHLDGSDAGHGEVYVIGVDPAHQGSGLGGRLLTAGLAHLAHLGLAEVLLYVEADNPAVHLYERAGFTHAPSDTHVQYLRR